MEGKIECKKPWFEIGQTSEENSNNTDTVFTIPTPVNCDVKSCKEWIAYIAKEDPDFILGAYRKLWNFIYSDTKIINKDELADKIGLTEDEFNFFTSMTLF